MSDQEKQAREKQPKPLADNREQRLGAEQKAGAAKGRDKPNAAKAVAALAAVVERKEAPEAAPVPPGFFARPAVRRAAMLGIALCVGALAGAGAVALVPAPEKPAPIVLAGPDWTRTSVFGAKPDLADGRRLGAEIRAVRSGIQEMKEALERNRQEAGQRAAEGAERLDRLHRADEAAAARLAALGERLERMEKERDPRIAEIAARLERIEKQLATSTPTAAAPKPAEPAATGSVVEKTPAKKAPIEGWVLREVYDGSALVEGRNRRLREIAPGQTLPGAGKIEAIERRGRTWVVVTDRGIITSQQW
ncbi:MAG TPA: hypothetical protein VM434_10955 [Beijerinckiaceae bacterium]|nr:hypothetical protein [Beijerinckiaceae bacterium]